MRIFIFVTRRLTSYEPHPIASASWPLSARTASNVITTFCTVLSPSHVNSPIKARGSLSVNHSISVAWAAAARNKLASRPVRQRRKQRPCESMTFERYICHLLMSARRCCRTKQNHAEIAFGSHRLAVKLLDIVVRVSRFCQHDQRRD